MKKVPASEATRKRLEEGFGCEQIDPGQIVREATRLMIEQVLEAEVEQAVGRQYYAHGRASGDEPRPLRNGVRGGRIDSAEGVIEFNAPQVRGLSGWTSDERSALAGKSEELTRLAVEMYARDSQCATSKRRFEDDFEACIAHLRLPIGHRRAIRTTNLLERMFGEERRRTKIIPHAFGEKAVMKPMYAALMRARQGWRNVVITLFEVKQIQSLREHLNNEFEQRHASPLKRASRSRIHSTNGT